MGAKAEAKLRKWQKYAEDLEEDIEHLKDKARKAGGTTTKDRQKLDKSPEPSKKDKDRGKEVKATSPSPEKKPQKEPRKESASASRSPSAKAKKVEKNGDEKKE